MKLFNQTQRTLRTIITLAATCTLAATAPQALAQDEPARQDTPAAQAQQPTAAAEAARPEELTLETVRVHLAEALSALGVPSPARRQAVAAQLEQVAQRSNELAQSLPEPGQKLEARNLEAQAYNALANQAEAENEEARASERIEQMRTAAADLKTIASPDANLVGEFWLLQADLFELKRGDVSQALQQRKATLRLQRFLDEAVPDEPVHDPLSQQLVTEVKLSLLRLYDQLGQSASAQRLASELREAADTQPEGKRLVEEWFGYTDLVGQPFSARLQLSDDVVWSSEDQLGSVVLIHFDAGWLEPSIEAQQRVRQAYEQFGDAGLSVLTVKIAPPAKAEAAQEQDSTDTAAPPDAAKDGDAADVVPWPVYHQGPGQVRLDEMFSVKTLPRFVLIDARGRIVAIAGSPAVLERLPRLLPAAQAPAQPVGAEDSDALPPLGD